MALNSFRVRLIIGAIIWIGLGTAVCGFTLSQLFKKHVDREFDTELHDHAAELALLIEVDSDGAVVLHRDLSDQRFSAARSGYYWQIERPDGVLLSSTSLGVFNLASADQSQSSKQVTSLNTWPAGTLRIAQRDVTIGPDQERMTIRVGIDQKVIDAVLWDFNKELFVSLGIIAVGLTGTVSGQIIFGLSPLTRIRRALAAVRSGESKRLPEDLPSEVMPLVSDLNAFLDLNCRTLRGARVQASNLAHALKNPLAILSDEIQRLQSVGQTDASRILLQQCEQMKTLIDYQMARARAVSMRAVPGAVVQCNVVASSVIQALSRLYRERRLVFEFEPSPNDRAACDPDDFTEILANLVDNAAKWARSRVRISIVPAQQDLRIKVEDDGAGMAPETMNDAFDIGRRFDSNVPGSGLGLAIVRDVATFYGGTAYLENSELGGVSACVNLPRAAG